MLYPEYKWVDVAFGGANKRNNLVEVTKLKVPKDGVDCYRTIFRYPEAMKKHFEKHGTVSGYVGEVYADWLPVDIDDSDIAEAHRQVRLALERLAAAYDVVLEELKCFFSGSKGFHVLIPARMFGFKPSAELPHVFRELVEEMLGDFSVDLRIYDHVRLFRLTNTKNSKSGLYKIPLTAAEVLHMATEEILELAKSPRQVDFVPDSEIEANPILQELYEKILAKSQDSSQKPLPLNGARRESSIKPCIKRLLEGVEEGERNEAALRIAVHYAKEGLAQDMLAGMLRAWNQRNSPPLPEKELDVVAREAVEKPYDYGCNDELLRKYCGRPCPVRRNREDQEVEDGICVKTVVDAQDAYLEYVEGLKHSRISLGFGAIDSRMRGIAPGEVCQVIARSAVGKTTLLLNVLFNISRAGTVPVVFCTMEMPLAQVFERMCQIATEKTGHEVERAARDFLDGNHELFSEIARKTLNAYRNVYFVENDGLSLSDLEEVYHQATQVIGEKPKVLAIDYMGRMRGGYGTPYEVTSRLAKGLKYLAKKLKVAVISLHQTSREGGGDGTEPVTIQSARDSGAVEEAADFIIGLWRPEKKEAVNSDEERVALALLKNRRGAEIRTEIIFRKPTLRMYEPEVFEKGLETVSLDELPDELF